MPHRVLPPPPGTELSRSPAVAPVLSAGRESDVSGADCRLAGGGKIKEVPRLWEGAGSGW